MNNSFHKQNASIIFKKKLPIINEQTGFVFKFRKIIKDNRRKNNRNKLDIIC